MTAGTTKRPSNLNERGAAAVEYSCMLALLLMAILPVFAGDNDETYGFGQSTHQVFLGVGKAISRVQFNAMSHRPGGGGSSGGSEGSVANNSQGTSGGHASNIP